MKSLRLSKSGLNKVRAGHIELKSIDFDESIKSCPPGEWCLLQVSDFNESWLGFVNPLVDEKYAVCHIVQQVLSENRMALSPQDIIENKIKLAIKDRLKFKGYVDGARLFYGDADGLNGLIVDSFKNITIIQINTAGLDKYREHIRAVIQEITDKPAYFLDNQKYREKESLPIYPPEDIPSLEVVENQCFYKIRQEVIQKVGFYYDHRENRNQLVRILSSIDRKFHKGVDLFCYIGAWGVNALKAGVVEMDFVDQGDFETEVMESLSRNSYSLKGNFIRQDVFKFLDQRLLEGDKYDVLICDPPAFAKSSGQKDQALDGYSKLHRKVFKLAAQESVVVFSSCTHYVNHDEFQKNIIDAAKKEQRKIQLLYSGIQGWDHPITNLTEKSNYIKSFFYFLR